MEVDLSSMEDTCLPTYRVANRFAWVGERHTTVNGRIRALAEAWNPAYLIIDATGVGEGLASLLHARFGERVKPIKFTPAVKSELGWQFLAIIETGRYREYDPFDEEFAQQLDLCQSEILPGPAHTMRWGVPDGTRDQQGHFVHDDMVISAAMCSCLDALEWKVARPTGIINPAQEPLREMDERF